jgi:hypothetical protein
MVNYLSSVKVFLSDKKSKSFRGFFFISACDEALRPTEKKFHWSRRLIATNRIFAATNRIFAAKLTTCLMGRVSWHAACPHVRMAFNYITTCQETEILAVRRFVIVVSLGNAALQNVVKDDAWRRGVMKHQWRL